jgi:hypothetical protein
MEVNHISPTALRAANESVAILPQWKTNSFSNKPMVPISNKMGAIPLGNFIIHLNPDTLSTISY